MPKYFFADKLNTAADKSSPLSATLAKMTTDLKAATATVAALAVKIERRRLVTDDIVPPRPLPYHVRRMISACGLPDSGPYSLQQVDKAIAGQPTTQRLRIKSALAAAGLLH
jgi:hypothetical protein